MAHRVVAVIADQIGGPEAVEQLRATANGSQVELRLVAAPVEATPFRHTMGDVDEPKREATANLEASLAGLREEVSSCADGSATPTRSRRRWTRCSRSPRTRSSSSSTPRSDARWFEDDLEERAERDDRAASADREARIGPAAGTAADPCRRRRELTGRNRRPRGRTRRRHVLRPRALALGLRRDECRRRRHDPRNRVRGGGGRAVETGRRSAGRRSRSAPRSRSP